jgi:flagellar hook assembly protein FlgD
LNRRVAPGAAVFFVLLALTLICAIVTVRARTPDLVLEETGRLPAQFAPTGPGPDRDLGLSFFVRESDPHAAVTIVDAQETVVRTIDPDVALTAEREVEFSWDGRDEAGRPVPAGRYRLAVELPAHDREMIWPQRITVGAPPQAFGTPGEEDES